MKITTVSKHRAKEYEEICGLKKVIKRNLKIYVNEETWVTTL
jgi:hypothetical protein